MRPGEAERKSLDGVRRHVEYDVRGANRRSQHQPVLFGKLDAELVESGSALMSIYHYSLTTSTWVDTLKKVTVRDFFLGPDESWPASTRIRAIWYETTWVVDQASCSPDSGGGGGGGGSGASMGLHLGTELGDGDFFPGGLDYGGADYPYGIEQEFDSLLGV